MAIVLHDLAFKLVFVCVAVIVRENRALFCVLQQLFDIYIYTYI